MTHNMTSGKPARLILVFMIPLLVGNLFQQFYNMADTFIVGRTISVNALAAVGCTGSITFLILGFAMGVTSGMAIVTAQRFGAQDADGVRRSFAVAAVISAGVTAVLTPISVLAVRGILTLLKTPPEIMEDAYRYIVVILAGTGASMMFNLLSNVMRAVGDSRSPLAFLVLACILNIVLDYLLILVFGMGVRGAAVATIVAQIASGGLCVLYIARRIPALRLTRQDWRFTGQDVQNHLRLGLPMGFQSSIIALGAIALQFALNGLGADSVAAFTAAQKIDTLGTLPLMSFGVTMATFVAQNHGAGKHRRILRGVVQGTILSVAFSVLMALVNVFFGDRLAAVFVGANPAVAERAHQYLILNGTCYFLLAALFIFRYTLQGLGQSLVPTIAGVMELAMRSFAAVVLTHFFGYTGACLASPLAWLGACVPLTIALVITLRRLLLRAEEDGRQEPGPSAIPGPDAGDAGYECERAL